MNANPDHTVDLGDGAYLRREQFGWLIYISDGAGELNHIFLDVHAMGLIVESFQAVTSPDSQR